MGHLAVQLAKAKGATVYATCSERNVEFVKSIGADKVFDYTKQDFSKELAENNEQVDVVLDCVGGFDLEDKSMPIIKSTGAFVTISAGGGNLTMGNVAKTGWRLMKNKTLSYFNYPSYYIVMAKPTSGALEEALKLVEEKKLNPHISHIFSLDKIKDAHKQSASHRTVGKIVLDIESSFDNN